MVVDADLLVHVVDASAADPHAQINAVRGVLRDIGAGSLPELVVFNKIDIADDPSALMATYEGSCAVSAVTGEGSEQLLHTIGDRLAVMNRIVDVVIPFDRGDVMAELHRSGQVLSEQAGADGMRFRARLDEFSIGRLREWVREAEGQSAQIVE